MKKYTVKTFEEYQDFSRRTATYPELGNKIVYPLLGLVGETGEVAEKVKKLFRDKEGEISDEFRDDLKKEMGDILWYFSQLASELDISLEDIASTNITKLNDRLERDKIHGDGDNR